MSKLAVVFGGSGFLGRQVVRQLCREGWRVRIAVRRAHQAVDLRVEGAVGQVQLVQCNIRSERSVALAMNNAQIAINLVGILFESGRQKFNALHGDGAGYIARAASRAGVQQFVHVSALGAAPGSKSAYARSKAEGEAQILQAFPKAVILRPSVLFGSGDGLFERFAAMAVFSPVLPLPNSNCKMQPVFVGDVAKAVIHSLRNGTTAGNVYQLGGPETVTLGQLVQTTTEWIDRPRLIISLPALVAKMVGFVGDVLGLVPFVTPMITSDQVRALEVDNVVSPTALGFAELGINELETMSSIVPSYLGRFRKYGQFYEKRPI